MKFTWGRNLIKQNLNNLKQKKYKTEQDKTLICIYEQYLSRVDESDIIMEFGSLSSFKIKEKLVILNDTCHELSEVIDELPKKIQSIIYNLIYGLGDIYTKLPHPNYKICLDDENPSILKEQSYQIYQSIDNKFTKYLDYIFDKRLIATNNKKLNYIFDNPNSFCYGDFYNNVAFILINAKDKSTSLSSTLNHEIAHAIDFLVDRKVFFTEKICPISEMHSIYMGLYNDNKLYESTNDLNYLKSEYNYLNYLKTTISKLYLLLRLGELDKMTLNKVRSRLEILTVGEINDIDETLFYLLNTSVDEIVYALSGVLAIHMLESSNSNELFVRNILNPESTIYKNLKSINFNFNDSYYPCEIFNEYCTRVSNAVRKRS